MPPPPGTRACEHSDAPLAPRPQVWEKEEAHAKEMKKVEELRKQMAEEREREELMKEAEAGGHVKREKRVDFLYQGSMVGMQAAREKEAGEARKAEADAAPARPLASTAEPGQRAAPALPSFYNSGTPQAQNEMWQRMTNDPLVAMKQQMRAHEERVKTEVIAQHRARAAAEAREREREERRAEKERRREERERDRERRREERRADKERRRDQRRGRSRSRSRSRSPSRGERSERRRSRSRERGERRRSRSQERGERRRERGDDRKERDRRDERDRRHRSRSRDGDGARGRSPGRDADGFAVPAPRRGASGRAGSDDGEGARELAFGLNHARGGLQLTEEQVAAQKAQTQERLRRAEERRGEEERAQRAKEREARSRREYRAGGLSEEERARRLAEMASNAQEHDENRTARLLALRQREAREGDELAGRKAADNELERGRFIRNVEGQVLGSGAGVGRYGSRGTSGGDATFRR